MAEAAYILCAMRSGAMVLLGVYHQVLHTVQHTRTHLYNSVRNFYSGDTPQNLFMEQNVTADQHGIVTLPFETKRFQANGTWYNVTEKIATGRMSAYQKLTATYGFGLNVAGFHEMLTKLWGHLNARKDAEASVLVYNALEGLTKVDAGQVQAFEICTLFINADNEDAKYFDEAAALKKIEDWKAEGIHADFFLFHAANSTVGYRDVYEKLSRTISERNGISSEG